MSRMNTTEAAPLEQRSAATWRRHTCRLCNAPHPIKVLPMPACPPVDNYRFAHEPEIGLPAFPMDLYQCGACGHAQLLDVVDPQLLYGNYIYTSSSSPDLDKHFAAYASHLMRRFGLMDHSFVIDIGSNDGLFLSKFAACGCRVLGIDPSVSAASLAATRQVPTVTAFLNADVVADVTRGGGADIVTANNVFSHADDLRAFAGCIRDLLKPNGVFVFEVSYLVDLVEKKIVDYIYHEHLSQHSVRPLRQFLATVGLKLFDVQRVPTKGGSIRCFAVRAESGQAIWPSVDELIAHEESAGIYNRYTYAALSDHFADLRRRCHGLLDEVVRNGGTVASYGASATATVLNELLGINAYFSVIVDDNPARHGRLSPGAHVPVVGRQALLESHFDVTFISSWRFAKQIIAGNKDYLAAGGQFIVPLPELKVIRK